MKLITDKDAYSLKIHRATGSDFQRFFSRLMKKFFGNDFIELETDRMDGGNDGFVPTQGIFFQLYGPQNFNDKEEIQNTIKRAKSKFKVDLKKIYDNWNDICELKEFVFVMNTRENGFPLEVTEFISKLISTNNDIRIKTMSSEDIWNMYFKKLSAVDQDELLENITSEHNSTAINNIEFKRNVFFTGRENILQQIEQSFNQKEKVSLMQIISGLGGIGKTQISLEYAHTHIESYDYIWWLDCEKTDNIMIAFKKFAECVGFDETILCNNYNIKSAVIKWMGEHTKWLFIYDNAEDYESIQEYMPAVSKGDILITSRNSLWDGIAKTIKINQFKKKVAIEFLVKRTKLADKKSAGKLADALGYFPLALEQAAAYINVNEGENYTSYLNLFLKYKIQIFQGFKRYDYKKSIDVTWNITLEKITDESAKEFLKLCSLLSPTGIDIDNFLTTNIFLSDNLQIKLNDNLQKNNLINCLTKYSLITIGFQDKKVFMHRLLQEVIKKNINEETYVNSLLRHANNISYNFENLISRNTFFSSLANLVCIANNSVNLINKIDCAHLCSQIGNGLMKLAHYARALQWYKKALKIYDNLELVDINYIILNHCIAGIYRGLEKYKKNLTWLNKTISLRKKIIGEDEDLIPVYSNLVSAYGFLDDFKNAKRAYGEALKIIAKVDLKKSLKVAKLNNDFSEIYLKNNEFAKAIELLEEAIEIHKSYKDFKSVNLATLYNNLGNAYVYNLDSEKALMQYFECLNIQKLILEKDHPELATSYNNIGNAYYNLQDKEEALIWFDRAIEIWDKRKKEESVSKSISHCNRATILANRGDCKGAICDFKKAINIINMIKNRTSLQVATIYMNLAATYYLDENIDETIKSYVEALKIKQEILGAEHPDSVLLMQYILRLDKMQEDKNITDSINK